MQTIGIIDRSALGAIAEAVFEREVPRVHPAYSEFGREMPAFASAADMSAQLLGSLDGDAPSCNFAVWYPSSRGRLEIERIALDPAKCEGHAFRYATGGWGVIQLQFDFRRKPDIECRIAVNSEKRAALWAPYHPEYGPVSDWHWKSVNRQAMRLGRKLKLLALAGDAKKGGR